MASTSDFYGESVPEALKQACRKLATTQENLDVSVLETGSPGIFGLCKKKAHIRVSLKSEPKKTETMDTKGDAGNKRSPAPSPQKKPSPQTPDRSAPKPSSPAPSSRESATASAKSRPVELSEENLDTIRADLVQVLSLMGYPGEVDISAEGDKVQCSISGEHEQVLIGPGGKTLDSLQYLMGKMAGKRLATRIMLSLDAGDFRRKRLDDLKKQALDYADQVKEDGKTRSIASLNPSERRAVHLALQNDRDIRSRSVGGGLFKKVLIYPPGKGKKPSHRKKGKKSASQSDNSTASQQ